MLTIIQARLQQYVNRELPDVQAGFRKGRGTRNQIAFVSQKKQENSRKALTSASLTKLQPLTVDHNKLQRILKEMGISGHLTCLLRNLYAGQESSVRSGHGKTEWSTLGKEYIKSVYCHPVYLTYVQRTSCEILGSMKHKVE